MQLDTTAFIRVTASGSLGMSASGGAFATSTGDVLEVASFGPGVFRLRIGANTRPDYGLVIGRAQRCDITQIDLPRGHKSGLIEARQVLKRVRGIAFTHFQSNDVVRHPLVQRIVNAYERHSKTQAEPGT